MQKNYAWKECEWISLSCCKREYLNNNDFDTHFSSFIAQILKGWSRCKKNYILSLQDFASFQLFSFPSIILYNPRCSKSKEHIREIFNDIYGIRNSLRLYITGIKSMDMHEIGLIALIMQNDFLTQYVILQYVHF